MTERGRSTMIAVAGAALFALGLWAAAGLPSFGHYPGPYGDVLDTVAPHERQIPNVVTAVNFDYRGMDTLGEEYIFFAAVAGIALVLRNDRKRPTVDALPSRRKLTGPDATDAVRAFTVLALAVTVAFGMYLGIHAAQTPGGGFQGGALLSGFAALLLLGFGYPVLRKLLPQEGIEPVEAVGAGAYAAIGIATLVASGAFLKNVLPLGGEGQLFSAGTIPLINVCVGIEVSAGFFLLFLEFAHETRVEEREAE
ncbi:MAG: multicomponent Na+:H+ antiporter subunit [Candidatus Eremiobacteraeota bacterium]|jgi:multicomponent Na+:H+ antiporter subunit B|nr:multicomponent Na+:H+ antiporter subunit [Candidatus Eremiobacteraeota bacterium]